MTTRLNGPLHELALRLLGDQMGRERIVHDAIGTSRFMGAARHSPEFGIADELV
jgi:hypothetical protein